MMSARLVACTLPLLIVAFPTPRPAPRAQRSDADEIALALTAAPASLTAGAAVYVVRDSQFVKVRDGSTGWTCMVSRDARVHGVAPMCFDPEGARTLMQEEMLKTKLQSRGLSNTAIQHEVDAAFRRGTLRHPEKPAVLYMMSSRQVLVVYQGDSSRAIGAWHPHVMIYLPGASVEQFALGPDREAGPMSIPFTDAGGSELVIQVPHWTDDHAMSEAGESPPDAATGRR